MLKLILPSNLRISDFVIVAIVDPVLWYHLLGSKQENWMCRTTTKYDNLTRKINQHNTKFYVETQIVKKPRAARTRKIHYVEELQNWPQSNMLRKESQYKWLQYHSNTLSQFKKIVNNIWCRRILVKMLLGGDDPWGLRIIPFLGCSLRILGMMDDPCLRIDPFLG